MFFLYEYMEKKYLNTVMFHIRGTYGSEDRILPPVQGPIAGYEITNYRQDYNFERIGQLYKSKKTILFRWSVTSVEMR